MDSKPLLTVIVLGFVAGLTWWMAEDDTQKVAVVERIEGRHLDHFVRNLKSLTLRSDSNETKGLRASTLRQFNDDKTTQLEKVAITVQAPDKPSWKVVADRGWVSENGEDLNLIGDVAIRQTNEKFRPTIILTQNVRARPNESYAETDEPVNVTIGNDHIEAVGMKAWLKQPNKIQFLNQVRGQHEVPKNTPTNH